MDLKQILKMYNEDRLNLSEIGEQLNTSKSSISRLLAKEGYVFNKTLKMYIHKSVNTEVSETVNTGNNETVNTTINKPINNVSRETLNTVKCTFDLPVQLQRELKAKCALEGIKMVEFVREVLEKAIKDK